MVRAKKTKKVTLRISPPQFQYIQHAADIAGITFSDFLRSAAYDRAVEEIKIRQEVITRG